MLFGNRSPEGFLRMNDTHYYWKDADFAQVFTGPGFDHKRYVKDISVSYELFKQRHNIDCEDVIYVVRSMFEKLYIHETIFISKHFVKNVCYDFVERCVWVELGFEMWAPCYDKKFMLRMLEKEKKSEYVAKIKETSQYD